MFLWLLTKGGLFPLDRISRYWSGFIKKAVVVSAVMVSAVVVPAVVVVPVTGWWQWCRWCQWNRRYQ